MSNKSAAEPTEEQVRAAAEVIAGSPTIDAPKLPWPAWCGLARAILRAARIETRSMGDSPVGDESHRRSAEEAKGCHEAPDAPGESPAATLRAALAQPQEGGGVVTKNEAGKIVGVTRQDEEGRILSVIATSSTQAQSLTDAQIVEIRDDHLPSQGEPFDCIAFARAVLRATQSNGRLPENPATGRLQHRPNVARSTGSESGSAGCDATGGQIDGELPATIHALERAARYVGRLDPTLEGNESADGDAERLLELVERLRQSPAQSAPAQEPTITVSGPVACGKSYVMELIYKALRDAGLHPYSYELAHERRMVQEQPPPSAKVWHLREAVAAPQPAQADKALAWLDKRIGWLTEELRKGGNYDHLSARIAEAQGIRAYLARTGGKEET